MAAIATRPLLVALLLLAFCCQTIAAAAMHCRASQAQVQIQAAQAMAGMDMPEHHHHHDQVTQDNSQPSAGQHQADCCSTTGQCLMACSLAVANLQLPPALKMSAPSLDNYVGTAPYGLVAAPYKPPIFA